MTNKNKPAKKEQPLSEDSLDLIYEEIEDFDQTLDEYLETCRAQFLQDRANGSFPWPMYEDEDLENNSIE